ncbi:MAG: hypothetical protein JWM11_1960 [Planctomycetaceae bacterium]|nr:hypothetical protein [Planctomycetaceae bacterium]
MSFHPTDVHPASQQPNRRDFLRTLGASASLLVAGDVASATVSMPRSPEMCLRPAKHLIVLHLSGGPSHIDTFDPKPEAAAEFRNFDSACQTSIPGVAISENLPRLAARLGQVALIRSLYHTGPATHEAGQALLQNAARRVNRETGFSNSRLADQGTSDCIGRGEIVLGHPPADQPMNVRTSVGMFRPVEFDNVRTPELDTALFKNIGDYSHNASAYGEHRLGRDCWQARLLIERGARRVDIHQFATVYDQITWDMHANGGSLNTTHDDYRNILCPQLDQALSALLDDLRNTGLLEETVVVAVGEMGRAPRINAYGGRDHHCGAWTALIAGGPIRTGQVIGATDAIGGEPVDRAVSVSEFTATISHAMGITAALATHADRNAAERCNPIDELL